MNYVVGLRVIERLGRVSVGGVEEGVVGEDHKFSKVVGGGPGEVIVALIR